VAGTSCLVGWAVRASGPCDGGIWAGYSRTDGWDAHVRRRGVVGSGQRRRHATTPARHASGCSAARLDLHLLPCESFRVHARLRAAAD
jgi:hypothetical protein